MRNTEERIEEGTVERIVYFNEENGYTVARLMPDRGNTPVTLVGHLADVREGEHIRARGTWEENPKFGLQFKVAQCEIVPPSSLEGMERYLSSGLIRGIGPVMADRIVKKFGEDTLRIISEEPQRLRTVRGIGRKTLERIISSWEKHKELRDTMIFLQTQGITTAYATKIIKQYGSASMRVVQEDPYRLADEIHGIGFKQADSIARKMGIPHDSPARVAAAVLHILGEMAAEGHVYCPMESLEERCREMLDVGKDIIKEGMDALLNRKKIVVERTDGGETAVYLAALHIAETGSASLLLGIQSTLKLLPPINLEKAVLWFERHRGIRLNEGQKDAIRKAIEGKLLVITGGPGTGKTTVIRALVDIFRAKEQRVQLAAPTGRAAKRMEEVSGIPATTIHRMLEFSPLKLSFSRDQDHPLACDILVIDESSMLDIVLFYHMLKATPMGASIILVGDVDQLPAVGPGNVLKDLVESGIAEVVRLTEVFRQAEGSLIISNAHRINRGEGPILVRGENTHESDFHFIERDSPEEVTATIETLVTRRIPDAFGMDPLVDIQVLSPMHKGYSGVSNLNLRLQELLNPTGPEISHGSREFRQRDKVMQIRNNYEKEVFNGDVGFIFSVDRNMRQLTIDFDGRLIVYEFSELDELELAYAISVHKSQGSEYRAVVVPVLMQHFLLLQRNLIYTAVTRGKELVVLVGSLKALSTAVGNARVQQRHTHLRQRLRRGEPE